MPEYLYEFAALVTKDSPSQSEITKYMLSLRYHHKADLSHILSFSVLILSCNHLNYQKELNVSTIEQVFRQLILQADFFFILLTYSKLLPLLNWANGRPQRQIDEALGPAFRELTKPISSSKLSKPVSHQEAKKCLSQHLTLLQLLDGKNFFLFFFNLINGINQSLENDIDFYFMELASCGIEQEGLISSSQLAILQKNIELEYGKLRKRKYQEEIIETIYKWLEMELQAMFYEGQNLSNHLFMDLFTQVVQSQSNFSGTTLLQVLDTQVESIEAGKVRHFLQLVDTCLIQGTFKISTQTILFLVCTIFSKIHSKKLSIEGEVMMDHLLLWKEVAIKKQLPVKLLICLIEWLPLLYPKSITKNQQQPEILQLYRKEILRLANASQSSQISGLIVLVQELQYRKMEGIYAQLEEFHSQMEQPEKSSGASKPSSRMNQIDFHFKISGLSKSNSEINSLLNSLESLSQNNAKSKNIHLEILSKPQSQGSFGSQNSERSFRECVEIIMSLIELFDYHVKELSITSSDPSFHSKRSHRQGSNISSNSNFLPVVSTHHELSSSTGTKEKREREVKVNKERIKDLCINTTSYSEQAKKRMVKHRGLIIKKQSIEIGYLLDSKQSRVSFFVTFLKPVKQCRMRIRQNSFKVKGQKEWHFTEPKINKQYQISYQIGTIKLYSLEGVPNSERDVRSRLQLKIAQNKQTEEEIYDIPLTVFNLIEWLSITPADLSHFQQQTCLQTKWHPACPKLIKHGGDYLRKYFSFLQDERGNYLMKCRILGENAILVRLIMVLAEVKVQILNAGEKLVAIGLLEVIG